MPVSGRRPSPQLVSEEEIEIHDLNNKVNTLEEEFVNLVETNATDKNGYDKLCTLLTNSLDNIRHDVISVKEEILNKTESIRIELKNDVAEIRNNVFAASMVTAPVRTKNEVTESAQDNFITVQGSGDILSNSYPVNINFKDNFFESAEHAYQYEKCVYHNDLELAALVKNATNSIEAKKLGNRVTTNSSWIAHKYYLMEDILKQKSAQCEMFRKRLLKVSGTIIHTVTNTYWGIGCRTKDFKISHHYAGLN